MDGRSYSRAVKILCFHPALAPYRVDFFNLLCELAELKMVFLQENLQTQKFDQNALLAKLKVPYEYLTSGVCIRGRCVRTGILRIVRRERPDIILAYEASPVTVELITLKKIGFIKSKIWTSMDDSPEQVRSRRGLRRIMRDWVLRNVENVIVPSQAAADAYRSLPINDYRQTTNNYSVVPIIHDTATMRKNVDKVYASGRAWREQNCPRAWKRVFVFVGRFAEVKNLPWLIERMRDQPDTTGLVLVGDGVLAAELKAKVTALKFEGRVMFAGRKEGDELYSIMAMADALLLCSHSETFGAVVAEALQWGTPCIVASHLGASVMIEDGKNGAVFTYNDAKSFKDAIGRLPVRSNKSLLKSDLRLSVERLIKEI